MTVVNLHKDVICQMEFHGLKAWLRCHMLTMAGKAKLLTRIPNVGKQLKREQILRAGCEIRSQCVYAGTVFA